MSISDRIRIIYEWSGLSKRDLEQTTGIDRTIWNNVLNGRQRVNADHIEAVVKKWPEFAYWLTTGKVQPEAGNISPDIEEVRKTSAGAGQAS